MVPPLVSVVMPTFRRADYLPDAIESVRRQTFRDFELIVTDNGMSADVEALVASFGDDRLRYRHNGRNVGPMGNVAAAERECRSELLAVLHDDNLWEPTFLERLAVPLLDDPRLVLSFSDHFLMDAAGRDDLPKTDRNSRTWGREGLAGGVHEPFTRLAVVDRAVAVHVAVVHRRDALVWEGIPPEVELAYDLWSAYLIARGGAPAYYVPERLMHYRLHDSSLSSTYQLNESLLECYVRMLDDDALADLRPELERETAAFRSAYGIDLLCRREVAAARVQLRAALHERTTVAAGVALGLTHVPGGPRWARALRNRPRG